MKKFTSILIAALLAAFLCLPALPAAAGNNTWSSVFSTTDTADATAPAGAYMAFGGAVRYTGKAPVIKSAIVTGDDASSVFTVMTENGSTTTSDASAASGQKDVGVVDTDIFTCTAGAGSWVALYNASGADFEINRISSCVSDTTITMVRNLANTYASGTTVYELEDLYVLPVGAATVTWADANWYAKKGKVIGYHINGTAATTKINGLTGKYE